MLDIPPFASPARVAPYAHINIKQTKKNSPKLAVIASKSFGFRFLGRPFCLGGVVEVPLKKGTLADKTLSGGEGPPGGGRGIGEEWGWNSGEGKFDP